LFQISNFKYGILLFEQFGYNEHLYNVHIDKYVHTIFLILPNFTFQSTNYCLIFSYAKNSRLLHHKQVPLHISHA